MKIFLLVLLFFCLPAQASQCMSYSNTVTLNGTLSRKMFPGPPNYQSIAGGDREEYFFFLTLASPICVSPGQDSMERGVSRAKILQLIFVGGGIPSRRGQPGNDVTCTGKIWPRETAHHHSRILLANTTCMVPNNSFKPTAGIGPNQ
jgi:hypothetical protein